MFVVEGAGLATSASTSVHMNQLAVVEPGLLAVGGFFGLLVVVLIVSLIGAIRG